MQRQHKALIQNENKKIIRETDEEGWTQRWSLQAGDL